MSPNIWLPSNLSSKILGIYEQSTEEELMEGKSWYNNASSFASLLAERNKTSRIVVAGVIAALSPLKSWEHNKDITEMYFKGIYKHTGTQIAKCKAITESGQYIKILHHLGGLKTQNFFRSIVDPEDRNACCIDRHCIYLATGYDLQRISPKRYGILKKAYTEVARDVGISPTILQATSWVAWKRIKQIH